MSADAQAESVEQKVVRKLNIVGMQLQTLQMMFGEMADAIGALLDEVQKLRQELEESKKVAEGVKPSSAGNG